MALPGRGAMSSSPTSLSSPPASSISNPSSPSRLNVGRANIEMDEIVVDTASGPRFGVVPPPPPPPPEVPLTAAGVPRKKPGRKPGSTVKPKFNPDGTPIIPEPKVRKPRKPRDPNAPPIQRKRKIAATQEVAEPEQPSALTSTSAVPLPQPQQAAEASPMLMDLDPRPAAVATPNSSSNTPNPQPNPAKVPKREGPSFMSSLLNRDSPPPPPAPPAPVRMAFDPVRSSSYDPVRETMVTRDPYGTSALASPRGPSQMTNRASASPSISSLIDAPPPSSASKVVSPTQAHSSFHTTTQGRFQDPSSMPPSPSNQVRKDPPPLSGPAPKSSTVEIKKPGPPPMPQPPNPTEPFKPTAPASSGMPAPSTMPAPSKKLTTVVAQTRKEKKAVSSTSSSPKMGSLKNALPDVAPLHGTSSDRSILDFGKVAPGEEKEAPSIVLHIPLNGDGNKYVNFMRLAESKYGWDALHPREAANRDRKARIAAASAALERQQSGRDSAEEEDPEFNASEDENSNIEMGGMGNNGGLTSGADAAAPEKPKRKKRNWREDEYDRGDDFVDDSELMWEEQAAAVQDGFFVYSGPLVQDLPKATERDGPARRGRGRGGGPGSRGGRGRGEGGRGRGGGPGSRGGTTTRKPRITKAEKQQLDREKAEREQKAQQLAASKSNSGTNVSSAGSYGLLAGLVGPNASVPSLSAGLGAGIMNS